MDILKKVTQLIGKYRYAVLVLVIGLFLILLPTSSGEKEAEVTAAVQETVDIASQLEDILSQIEGVGRVKVMLTQEEGEVTLYQSDEGSTSRDTVIITDGNRGESGLIQQVNPPSYRGAIIVCQGADNAAVRLNVVEAVSKVTGLSTDHISVLKMK